jgi:hypothetical protein
MVIDEILDFAKSPFQYFSVAISLESMENIFTENENFPKLSFYRPIRHNIRGGKYCEKFRISRLPIADWSTGWSAMTGAITVGVSVTAGLVIVLLWGVWGSEKRTITSAIFVNPSLVGVYQ